MSFAQPETQPQQGALDFAPAAATEPAPIPVALPVPAPPVATKPASRDAPASAELWAAVQFAPEVFAARRAELLECALRFTPRVTCEPPAALLLEVAGSCRLFGGLQALLQRLRESFPAPLPIAVAPLPLAALVLARAGRARCMLNPARLASRLAPLPVALLHWPEEEQQRLRAMGIGTLGELLRLPREGLARRFGPARLDELDRLTGRRADPRESLRAVERFAERVDPGYETTDAGRLLAALAPALARLEDFLRARQRGVRALRLKLAHRRREPSVLVLRLIAPEYRAARFTALLAARLESLALAEPVRRIDLTGGALQRLAGDSQGLWRPGEQGGAGEAQLPEFLQTLMARLGEQAVYGLEPVAGHRPERQWRSTRPQPQAAAQRASAALPDGRHRPLGLLIPPLPLRAEYDAAGRVQALWHEAQALQLVSGPERIESGWWDGAEIARDYYIARDAHGALLWIFRECHEPHGWFLHGCFA